MPHTPGPWKWTEHALSNGERGLLGASTVWDDKEGCACGQLFIFNPADKPLIAQAPAMYELLKELEYCSGQYDPVAFCMKCGADEGKEHSPDCRLAAVLKAVEGET